MSLFGQKPASGLSINTTAANSGGNSLLGGGASQAPSTGGMFSSAATSQPQSTSLFGNTTQSSQAQSSGGLFGSNAQSSQPAPSGGLFATQAAQSSQPQQSGGLFGNAAQGTSTSQPAQSTGLFGNVGKPQTSQTGGLFGAAGSSQPQQASSLFGNSQAQPSSTSQPQPQQSGFFGGLGAKANAANPTSTLLGASTTNPAQSANQSNSAVKINLEHLRTTTRFEQLTDDLQKEIEALDSFILQQMTFSHEVADLLPAVASGGANLPNDVTFVSDKLEELQLGLENDATEISNLKDKTVAKDAAEAKLCFRGVDRLKMPAQYQQQQIYQSVNGTSAGGLSGWWNHPQTLQRSVRGASVASGRRNVQLPEDDEEAKAPSNLVEFFDTKASEMGDTLEGYKNVMQQIESHLDGVELTIAMKQRELNDNRSNGGVMGRGADEQVRNLRHALGVFERSIYDVADQIGNARDNVQTLGFGKAQAESRFGQSKLAW